MIAEMPKACRQAVTLITTKHFFFAPTLLRAGITFTTDEPTARIRPTGEILISPTWSAKFSAQQFVFLLCHECLHHMMAHAYRRGARAPARWNWAGDAWINETLIAEGIGKFIDGGIRYDGATAMTVEELYPLAPEKPPGGGGGSLGADLEVAPEDMTPAECAHAIAKANVELVQAANAAKQMGNLPQTFRKLVDDTLAVHTPWHHYLAEFMSRAIEKDYDFSSPDQTLRHLGLYVPGLAGEGAGKVVVILDESGSVPEPMLAEFGGHLSNILSDCDPEIVHVLHADTQVHYVDDYTSDELPLKLERHARGGTDMGAALRYSEENYPDAEAIIVLTDGETPWGEPTTAPIFWAITCPQITARHGTSVHIRSPASGA